MRWIFRGLAALFALVLLAVAGLFLVPTEKIADLAAERFETATGRALALNGKIRPTLWPTLGVTAEDVAVANAPWSDRGPMFRADSLKVGVVAMALLKGDVRITEVTARGPDILLEIGPDGQGNWIFDTSETATDPAATPPSPSRALSDFSLDRAALRNGSLRIVDPSQGVDRQVSAIDLNLTVPSISGRTGFDLSGVMNGENLRAKGHIDGLDAFLDRGAVPLALDLGLGAAKVVFDGRGGLTPLAFAGALDADLGNLSGPMRAMGLPAPELPGGLGRDRIAFSGDVTFTEGTLNLRTATLRLDDTTFTGAADLDLSGATPLLNAKLATPALNVSQLSKAPAPAGSPDAAASVVGWSRAPLDVSALHALDARLSLSADEVVLGKTRLGRTDLYTSLDKGRAVVEIREMRAYGGRVDGSVVVNARGGLSSRVDVTGSALAISSLLSEFLDFDRLIASGTLSINLLGVGNDVQTLMSSLDGQGGFSTSAGELLGLDLAGMLRNLDLNYVGQGAKTVFDKISASFRVEDGVLTNDDLRFLAPLMSAEGAGTVDLGARSLDYRIVARLLGDDGVRVPVTIQGPWADPKLRLDLEGLARDRLKDEARALENKAKDKAKEKIAEKLGVQIGEDERIEDALKNALEEKARDGLLQLLNRD